MNTLARVPHSIAPRHRRLLAALALAFACPGQEPVPSGPGTTTGTTTAVATTTSGPTTAPGVSESGGSTSVLDSTTADSTGASLPGPCTCVDTTAFEAEDCSLEDLAMWVPGCPEDQPCPRVTVACGRANPDLYSCRSELVFDEAAMQCALETLRDGTPARLVIDGLEDYGFSDHQVFLVHVLEGRQSMRAGCLWYNGEVYRFGPDAQALADPAYFTACMDEADPYLRYRCMMDGLGEPTEPVGCPESVVRPTNDRAGAALGT